MVFELDWDVKEHWLSGDDLTMTRTVHLCISVLQRALQWGLKREVDFRTSLRCVRDIDDGNLRPACRISW